MRYRHRVSARWYFAKSSSARLNAVSAAVCGAMPSFMILTQPALQTCSAALAAHCELVHLDLGGTVVELIAYEGASVEPAPKKEHLGYRVKFESCLLHRGVSDKLF